MRAQLPLNANFVDKILVSEPTTYAASKENFKPRDMVTVGSTTRDRTDFGSSIKIKNE